MVDLLADTWHSRELPLLVEIARRLEAKEPDDHEPIMVGACGKAIGLDEKSTRLASEAIADGGYLEGLEMPMWPGYVIATRLTPEGRRAVGLWPSTEVGVERLVAALDALAQQATTPDERSRWERIRDHVTQNGAQVGWSLVTAVLTGQLPGQ